MDCKEVNFGKNCFNSEIGSCNKKCEGKVLESSTLCECPNESMEVIPDFKVPVVIGEFTVQIDTESKIKLGHKAIEIKRIKKNVFVTQCRLVGCTGKVFISGFVRKNIEYATIDGHKHSAICGDIKHTTLFVPFKCVTKVENLKPVVIHPNVPGEETTFFDEKCMGTDLREVDFFTKEFFNEKVYCELVKAKIYEADIVEECKKLDCHSCEHVFQTFIEKEVIFLKIKLLQKQQISMDGTDDCHKGTSSFGYDKDDD